MGRALSNETWCTREWAAARLGVSTRSINNYVNRGFIRRGVLENTPVFSKEDVEQMYLDRGVGLPAMNRKNFIAMMHRVQKLEMQVETLTRIWDVQHLPLRPTAEVAKQMLVMVGVLLGSKPDLAMAKSWAKLFETMDETTFDLIGRYCVTDQTWQPFFQLCLKLDEYVSSLPKFPTDLELQQLGQQLGVGRKKLRSSALVWMELHKGTTGDLVMQALDTPKETFLRKLGKTP